MNRSLLIALVFILIKLNEACAQVPIITSVSPEKGLIGSFVTINGSNFGLTPPENIVYFGALKGVVAASTANQLIVHSPPATTQPISVTVNGLTAYSERPFMSIVPAPPFDATSLKGKIDIQSYGNHAIAVKDFDGDGKADIAIVGSGVPLQILKNKSTKGNAVFSIDLTKSGLTALGLAVGDLNGDGKPDIVAANYANDRISVFINSSTVNAIDFANARLYSTERNPYRVAIADFNGDGMLDIAVTMESSLSNSVLVFENATLLNGNFTLKPPKKFFTAPTPRGIEIGDIDLDGKIDIVVTCQSGAISVLKNTSTLTDINFAPSQSFSLPAGSSPESAVLADFDGDLKLDVAVANNSSNNISIFRGGVGGALFGDRKDYATGINNFGISVGDIDSDGSPDIAVTNQTDNSVSLLVNKSSPNNINFLSKIDFPVGAWPRASALADVDGDFKHDVIVANNNSNFISILLSNTQKQQAVINFPQPVVAEIGPGNILITNATSNNSETPIVYSSSNPNVAYVRADGKIEVIAPGTTVITANQPETASFLAAEPVGRTFLIKQVQTISFPTLPAKLICDADFSVNASSNTTQPLFYSSSNTAVATISTTGIIHIVGSGTTNITVNQPGNALYTDAVPKWQMLTITAPTPPTITIAADNNAVCNGSPAVFTATALNSGLNPTYQWTVNGSARGTNSNKFILNNIKATDIIQCLVTTSGNCSASGLSNSLSLPVQPVLKPDLTIQMAAGTFCQGDAITLTATPVNEGSQPTYEWLVNDKLVGTTSNPYFSYTDFINGDKISCVLTNTTSPCLAASSALSNNIFVNVEATPDPQLSISTPSIKVYGGTDVKFSVTSSLPVSIYQWQINNVNYGSNQPDFATRILKTGDKVKCIVTVNAPCAVPIATEEIVMDVTLPVDIKIPNAFTPNGDGINDVWTIPELSFFPDCIVNVFDRNGSLLFFSRGYANAWDGTANGKKLATGTYYYLIKTDEAKGLLRSGYITILN